MLTIYGIGNCDKCRKALRWFADNGIEHRFHDLRKDGLSKAQAKTWLQQNGAEALLNRRSATWRQLTASERAQAEQPAAADLLLAHPTLLKRPLVESGESLLVGYDEQAWRKALG